MSKTMDKDLKNLYTYILKHKWTPIDTSLQSYNGKGYDYFIDLSNETYGVKRFFYFKENKNE